MKALSRALSEGYQINADAFDFLSTLPEDVDMGVLVSHVIRIKSELGEKVITKADVERLLPREVISSGEPMKVIESGEIEVVSDPTDQIQ